MSHTRILVEAPSADSVFVVDVGVVSTSIDITTADYQQFLDAIRRNQPFRVQAEPVPVFWKTAQGSGVVNPNATVTSNPTQQGGCVPANKDPSVLQHLDPMTTHIIVATATGSGHLRFTSGRG